MYGVLFLIYNLILIVTKLLGGIILKNIKILPYENYNETEILDLYKAVGWSNYYNNPQMLKNGFNNSLCILGAYENEKLVGIIRVVGDGHSIIYIQDILIYPSYQHQKIGTNLINSVLEKYKNVYQKSLETDNTEKTINFYQSLGFKNLADIKCVAFQHLPE